VNEEQTKDGGQPGDRLDEEVFLKARPIDDAAAPLNR
jgi:hypothetical protein